MPEFRHYGDCPVLIYPDTGVCNCHMHMASYEEDAMRTVIGEQDVEMLAASLLVSEAGETMGVIHKERFQGHARNDERLLRECGDTLWALTVLLRSRGFHLSDAARNNIDKRKLRFPEGFDVARSVNREANDT
jgi:NTP pyrophosphatase (non-canonical NTP hydrolase)